MTRMARALVGALMMSVVLTVAHAVSKDAQELMTLRKKHAPVNCEMTKLYRQLGEARKAKDRPRIQSLTERMRELDKKLAGDSARMQELRRRTRQSPDYPAIMQQQLEFDRACNRQPAKS